ncbi:MAG: MBL fold metallo-hydrolase [Bacteroidales bacterium]|nr:MBL fold metallo-hydrolase [Bacteroidales bacterium]
MIKIFVHNHFQVNSTLVYDNTLSGVIIDFSAQTKAEIDEFLSFLNENKIEIKHILLTHPHIDHICGALWVSSYFNLPVMMSKDGERILRTAEAQAELMGFDVKGIENLNKLYIDEGEDLSFGECKIEVLSTPGHCDGSLSYYFPSEETAVVGDVLFLENVGRCDLPTGDFDKLKQSVKQKLFTLDDNTKCICGHGPNTTIGHEKLYNPYID